MYRVTSLTDEEIRKIGDAYADYTYSEGEVGMTLVYKDRQAVSDYICGFVRAMIKNGSLYTTAPEHEGYIAYYPSWKMMRPAAVTELLRTFGSTMGIKGVRDLISKLSAAGESFEDSLKKAKKKYIFVALVAVPEEHQGKGHMRKLLEFAFEKGRENNCPVILDTDDSLKKTKYEHLGMKTVRTRKIADDSLMYDLVWEPDESKVMSSKDSGKEIFKLLNKQIAIPETEGFYGAYYPNKKASDKAMILMLGDSSDDRLAASGAKWVHELGCHALAMSPSKKDYGHHNYPIERFGAVIAFLKARGVKRIGIAGASTTGMLALVAASYYPDITLTIAMSPSDFVMEGFYQDGKDGMRERPGDNESTITWKGEPLPYLPYAYRHPEYWQKIQEESKEGGDMVASRKMFDESERRHPLQEDEKIKVENIKGHIVFIGAEDDVLWDTCKYIRRMEERLSEKAHDCTYLSLIYEHGTHFVFPESLMRKMLPVGADLMTLLFKAGREHPQECKAVREDIDIKLREVISEW